MKAIFDFIINDFLCEPVILIGVLIAVGYILQKKSANKIIVGTITAMVGIQMVLYGGTQFTNLFRPIMNAVNKSTGIQGYIMDMYIMLGTSEEALGSRVALIGYVFVIAFAVNILLVFFGKWTKAKGVFLTSNIGIVQAQGILWLVISSLVSKSVPAVIVSGVLTGIYWAYSTTICYNAVQNVTGGANFTVGHNIQFGLWFFDKLAPHLGKKSQDVEKIKLPKWLKIFNNSIVSVCLVMWVFVGAFLIPLGWDGITELSEGVNPIIYILMIGINFSMNMVIIMEGVKLMCSELTESFKGIQQKIVPNAVPALDVPVLLSYSQNAATLGLIFCTLGTLVSIGLLIIFKSSIIVLPSFIPLFFAGGPIGVVANKRGGIKATVICSTLTGVIQTFGTVWAIKILNYPEAIGWSGMFDFASFWPAVTEIMRFISKIFGFGGYLISI